MNDYRIIYQNFIDLHKSNGIADYRRVSFDDTATFIVLNEKGVSLLQAREMLNQLMPDINALNKIKDAS